MLKQEWSQLYVMSHAIISRMPLPVYTEKQANASKYNNYPFDAASGHTHGEEPLPFHVPEDETGYVCTDNGANVLLEGSH